MFFKLFFNNKVWQNHICSTTNTHRHFLLLLFLVFPRLVFILQYLPYFWEHTLELFQSLFPPELLVVSVHFDFLFCWGFPIWRTDSGSGIRQFNPMRVLERPQGDFVDFVNLLWDQFEEASKSYLWVVWICMLPKIHMLRPTHVGD